MIIWQRLASKAWLEANESRLEELAGPNMAIITRPNRAQALIQVSCKRRNLADNLVRHFGGKIEPIRHDWWKVFANASSHLPLSIGRRLKIVSAPTEISAERKLTANGGVTPRKILVIPAAGAFGTGEHPTTAMSLRLLEETTRDFRAGWRLLDAGTGSGILALAARRFGASETLGLDNDPSAVMNARHNARLNHIARARFVVADILRFKPRDRYEVVTANLFSELLIAALPVFRRRLKAGGLLIVSGILREQADSVLTALDRAGFDLEKKRRRGKWLTLQVRGKKQTRSAALPKRRRSRTAGLSNRSGARRPKKQNRTYKA